MVRINPLIPVNIDLFDRCFHPQKSSLYWQHPALWWKETRQILQKNKKKTYDHPQVAFRSYRILLESVNRFDSYLYVQVFVACLPWCSEDGIVAVRATQQDEQDCVSYILSNSFRNIYFWEDFEVFQINFLRKSFMLNSLSK